MLTDYYTIHGINPMPWKSPSLGMGRGKGKPYPTSYPNTEMLVYQNAIKDYMVEYYHPAPHEGPLELRIWYWRSLNYGGQRRQVCDVTNMNKALEDALQGVLFANDTQNKIVSGTSVIQAKDVVPQILIGIGPFDDNADIPWKEIHEHTGSRPMAEQRAANAGVPEPWVP